MARRASALALLALLLVGCSEDRRELSEQELARLVVLPADLPDDFVRFDEGRLARSDTPRGDQGWKARYRRAGGAKTTGALVVDSRVEVYEDGDAAGVGFDSYRGEVPPAAESLPEPELGDEAYAATLLQEGASGGVRFFFVGWRSGEMTGTLSVSGFDGRVAVDDALVLARAQAGRIDAAD
jgi:hypothetical protein